MLLSRKNLIPLILGLLCIVGFAAGLNVWRAARQRQERDPLAPLTAALKPDAPALLLRAGRVLRSRQAAALGVKQVARVPAAQQRVLRRAWKDGSVEALEAVLRQAEVTQCLWWTPNPDAEARQRLYAPLQHYRALSLAPLGAVYRRHTPAWRLSPQGGATLAALLRTLLQGAPFPEAARFPALLQQRAPQELMIVLSRGPRPVIWRSARAEAAVPALRTALKAIRSRWQERLRARLGPLSRRLPELRVEVWRLERDGDFSALDPALIRAAIRPVHGIGFEHRSRWHYALPWEVQQHGGPWRTLAALLRAQHLDPGQLPKGLSAYRLRPVRIGQSLPPG